MILPAPEPVVTVTGALDEFMLALRAANRSLVTIRGYQKTVCCFARWLAAGGHPTDLKQLTTSHIRLWLADLQARDGLKDVSVQSYFRSVRAFVNWAEREELIAVSPFRSGRLPSPKAAKRIKASYTVDELQRLVAACAQGEFGRRDLAMVLLLLDTGIRAAELCGLQLKDFEHGRIKVMGKGSQERYALINPQTEKAIRAYLRERRVDPDDVQEQATLFLGRQGALTTSGLLQIIKRRCRQAGIAEWGVHKMRRTFAVQWASGGGPLNALQAMLGHSTPTMSMRYAAVSTTELETLHQQFSPLEKLNLKKKK